MTVYIFGLGSIGQRHVRLLRELDPSIQIVAVQTRRRPLVIHDDLSVEHGIDPAKFYGIGSVSMQEFQGSPGDIAFICNPIALHVPAAEQAAAAGMHVFIEKPVSHSLDGLDRIQQLTSQWDTLAYVGYNLRFHPAVLVIRDLLLRGVLGGIHGAAVHFGEWLPGMHRYEDYRLTHMARRVEGGGVVLSLSHEVDLVRFLFGEPESAAGFCGTISSLEIDTDDTLSSVMVFDAHSSRFPLSLSLNFLDSPPRRFLEVRGSEGRLHWDYFSNEISLLKPHAEPQFIRFPRFQRNDMFRAQLGHFFDCIDGHVSPVCNLEDGAATLRLCLKLLSLPSIPSK